MGWLGLLIAFGLACSSYARTLQDNNHRWKTGEWGTCYVKTGCGEGSRERAVWCEDATSGQAALQFLCQADREPDRIKSCFVVCRHHRDSVEWHVEEWGDCRPSSDRDADSDGVSERNVSCVLITHDKQRSSLVVDEENCRVFGGDKPATSRPCSLPRRQQCVLTEWTDWSPCCDATKRRTRSVLVAPSPGAPSCPELSEWVPCEGEDKSCLRPKGGTRLRVERWGECRVEAPGPPPMDSYFKHWPQVGTQRRVVTCLDPQGQTLDISECLNERVESGLPMKERACIVSQDCIVSEWTEWNNIQEGCIDPYGKEWPDISERRREILRLHEGQGQPCPHLIETKSNSSNLPLCSHRYRWVSSKWSDCELPGNKVLCGGGLQTRNISCVKAGTGQPLSDKSCRALPPPHTVQRCEEACPRDCELTEWEQWGPCVPERDNCTMPPADPMLSQISVPGIRVRKRSIAVAPSSEGMGCDSLVEIQSCTRPLCYVWSTGPWSSCLLENLHNMKCGQGKRVRTVSCVSHSGEAVSGEWCSPDTRPDAEETCLLPCPYDCVVSPWSSWSPCSQACSTSKSLASRSRNRTIIAPPGPGGHECPDPDEMLQIEGCNVHGCHGYSWVALTWQECNATCDTPGYQIREVYCAEKHQYASLEKSVAHPACRLPFKKSCHPFHALFFHCSRCIYEAALPDEGCHFSLPTHIVWQVHSIVVTRHLL